MFGRRETYNADADLKEALLRRLSHSVKEVQLHHSKTGEAGSTDEGTSSLLVVLEAIFLHALKRSFFESARKAVADTDDVKPTPSFFAAVERVTHKNTKIFLSKQNLVTTDVGLSRAWLRLSLNEAALSSYMCALKHDRQMGRHYRPTALVRDKECLDTAASLLEGLISLPFTIPINSSLLNEWSTEPLLVSGLWSPALRNTATTAQDVAGDIEDDDACSIVTSTPSVSSLQIIDDKQFIDGLFGRSPLGATPPMPELPVMPPEMTEKVEEKLEELAEERRTIMQRSFSNMFTSPEESMLALIQKSQDEKQTTQNQSEPNDSETPSQESPLEQPIPPQAPEAQKPVEIDYASMLDKESEITNVTKLIESYLEVENKDSNEKSRLLENLVLRIPREIGLKDQNFECLDCKLSFSVGPILHTALLCQITGEYLCPNCHHSATHSVPSRIIFNWDHTKYPIGDRAAAYIGEMYKEPIFDLDALNPKLYRAVKDMKDMLVARKQLNFLFIYVSTCKSNTTLPIREYLGKSVHFYSLSDLISVPSGALKAELAKVIDIGRKHVINCWICREKGFICEVCQDPQVIYPFDEGSIYRCNKCQAVYHGTCLSVKRNCPKCQRRRQRLVNRENV